MPLIEDHPLGELAQGDILRSLNLCTSSVDGQPQLQTYPYSLVLSRNCRAVRDTNVVVAAVQSYAIYEKLKDKREKPDELRRIFDSIRDGTSTPDVFYLGALPGGKPEERFAARLDAIFTFSLAGIADRQLWVTAHRAARLTREHLRQLHIRLMNAFAVEGYDDLAWWPQEDLDFFLGSVSESLSRKSAEINDAERQLKLHDIKTAEAKQPPSAKMQDTRRILDQALKKLRDEHQTMKDTYEPHFAQQRRLRGDAT